MVNGMLFPVIYLEKDSKHHTHAVEATPYYHHLSI